MQLKKKIFLTLAARIFNIQTTDDAHHERVNMKTIQVPIDDDLLARVNQVIEQQKTTWTAFIQESFVHYLNRVKIKELEKQHREGYVKHPVQTGEFDVWEKEQAWEA